MRNSGSKRYGFVLIEIIISIVLLGIIGIFTSMFLYTGINAFFLSKQTSDGAMRAQIALDRINLELRKITSIPPGQLTVDSTIMYISADLPGTRRIFYTAPTNPPDNDNGFLSIEVDGNSNILIDNLTSFNLSLVTDDLNNSGADEVSGIIIGFTIAGVGRPFNLRIYPRNWIDVP